MGSEQSTDTAAQETAAIMQEKLLSNGVNGGRSGATPKSSIPSVVASARPVRRISTSGGTGVVPIPRAAGASPLESANIISKSDIEAYFGSDFDVRIDPLIFEINTEIIQLRRYFHENPELSYEEINTSRAVAKFLRSRDIEVYENVGKTGVVGVLRGTRAGNGPCILLRADMDALPIAESNDVSYKSKNTGVMHACGHDCHMAILLSVARILTKAEYLDKICGTIKFCFQPAEEGGAGAKAMIDEKVLEADEKNNIPRVDQVYGLHVWSYEKFGKCVVRDGPLMAGTSSFYIKVTGKGGHGAEPKGTKDAIVAATQLVLQLHTVISRNLSPLEEGVLTVGKLKAGDRGNIIAETADLDGTMRWFDEEVGQRIRQRMASICKGIEASYGVKCALRYGENPYPPTVNNYACTLNVAKAVNSVLPEGGCIRSEPTMAAEDFSFFLNERPGNYFFLGCGVREPQNPDAVYAHHKPNFRVDERCLVTGVQIFVNLVVDLMKPGALVAQEDVNAKGSNDGSIATEPEYEKIEKTEFAGNGAPAQL